MRILETKQQKYESNLNLVDAEFRLLIPRREEHQGICKENKENQEIYFF